MFNSTVLDVAIGMIFVYLLLSLMCSAANEIIELMLKKRAVDLERGIRELLAPGSESGTNDIVQKLYNHSLVNSLFGGRYENSRIASVKRYVMRTQLPSYIPARSFSLALMDLLAAPREGDSGAATNGCQTSGAAGATPTQSSSLNVTLTRPPPPPPLPGAPDNPLTSLRQAIGTTNLFSGETERVRTALIALIDAAGNDVAKARENIEGWFNNSMDRVASWYKRRTQIIILILGLLVTVAVNADSIAIVKKLSTDRALRESLVNAAQDYSRADASAASPAVSTSGESAAVKFKATRQQLENLGLPLGWEVQGEKWPGWDVYSWGDRLLLHGAGWLLTAFAISIGAPFWFDLLNKFIIVRSAVKPHEKSPEEESKD